MSFDQYLPDYVWSAAYSVPIDAPPERIFAAVESADFSNAFIVRATFAWRRLPRQRLTVEGFLQAGQFYLVRDEPREILLGLMGRPWLKKNQWRPASRDEWFSFQEPDNVRLAWGFRVQTGAKPGEPCRLITETRVQPTDEAGRRSFGRYWRKIAFFSGLVRKAMLNEIRLVALSND